MQILGLHGLDFGIMLVNIYVMMGVIQAAAITDATQGFLVIIFQ